MAKRKHAYLILRSGQTLTVSVPEDPWPRQIHHRMDQGELITFTYVGMQHGVAAYREDSPHVEGMA